MKQLVEHLAGDFPYISILATDVTNSRFEVKKTETRVADSILCERGFVVRVYNGTNYSEFSFNECPEDTREIESFAREVKLELTKSQDGAGRLPFEVSRYPLVAEEGIKDSWYGEVEIDPGKVDVKEKIHRLTRIKDQAFKQSDLLIDVRVSYEEAKVSKMFLSNAKELDQAYIWTQGSLVPIVRRGDKNRYFYKSFSGMKGCELLKEMEADIAPLVKKAENMLDAGTIEPGEYDVICSPMVAGLIAHEAFGHGVEMDMFVKKRAKAVEYLDKPVASPLVTMYDGAQSAKQVSSYFFDDEGTLGSNTVVIDKGILKRGISDLLSAFMLGTEPTGNGKRQSFERKAYARMTNTFFAPGADNLAEMIASIKHGYLLDEYQSGMEDPKNWGIQCVILNGEEIKDGRLTGRTVTPVMMTGYVPDLLKSISMVSGDVKLFGSGYCGKGYKEMIKTSIGGPYLKTKARLG